MTTAFAGTAELAARLGEELGTSDWVTIDQDLVDHFAIATFDHHWIHTDPERAAASPIGGTIAHGFHSLALIGGLMQQVIDMSACSTALNYGLEKVRFPAMVRSGARLRLRLSLDDVTPVDGGITAVFGCVIEMEGSDRPACVAASVARYLD